MWLAKKLTQNSNAPKLVTAVASIPALLIFTPLPDQLFAFLTLLIIVYLSSRLAATKNKLVAHIWTLPYPLLHSCLWVMLPY